LLRVIFSGLTVFSNRVTIKNSEVVIIVEGHADFDQKGEDLVCAAVSVLSQTMILSLEKLTDVKQEVTKDNGFLKTEFKNQPNQQKELEIIISNFYIGLLEIKKEYLPKMALVFV